MTSWWARKNKYKSWLAKMRQKAGQEWKGKNEKWSQIQNCWRIFIEVFDHKLISEWLKRLHWTVKWLELDLMVSSTCWQGYLLSTHMDILFTTHLWHHRRKLLIIERLSVVWNLQIWKMVSSWPCVISPHNHVVRQLFLACYLFVCLLLIHRVHYKFYNKNVQKKKQIYNVSIWCIKGERDSKFAFVMSS